MKRIIIFFLFLFCQAVVPLSALVLKNDTENTIQIISFMDAQGWKLNIPTILEPQQITEIQNISYQNGKSKQASLEYLTMIMQIDTKKQVLILNASAKDFSGMNNGIIGLTFGIPATRKIQRRFYELQEKFPGQLNVRTQNVMSMKKC